MTRPDPLETLSSNVVHSNPHFGVTKDGCVKPDGSDGNYYKIHANPGVLIAALDKDFKIHLIETIRYKNGGPSIEVPGGGTDGLQPLEAAQKELLEETGLTAASWRQLGKIHPLGGIMDKDDFVFLATDLAQTDKHKQEDEGIVAVHQKPMDAALNMIRSGEITDTGSIAVVSMAALAIYLGS